jgi:FkbM family methyltransferase
VRVWVNPRDYVGRAIYFMGDLDPKVTWVVRRVLRRGDTFLDIGANHGLVALMAARLVGLAGHVHAFEPQPRLAALLRRSAGEAGPRAAAVGVHELALSDHDGAAALTIPGDNAGAASLHPEIAGPGATVQVRLARGDAYLRALGLGPVRAMKVDVEGHEGPVFSGLSGLLGSDLAPEVIVFESANDRPVAERPACRVLASFDYFLADLPPAVWRARACWVDAEHPARGHDLVAVRASACAGVAPLLGLPARRAVRLDLPAPAAGVNAT